MTEDEKNGVLGCLFMLFFTLAIFCRGMWFSRSMTKPKRLFIKDTDTGEWIDFGLVDDMSDEELDQVCQDDIKESKRLEGENDK